MRFILLLFIIFAAASFGLYGYGKNLPKAHKFSIQQTYEQPIELVWQGVSNYEILSKWDSNTKNITKIGEKNDHEIWRIIDARDKYMDLEIVQSKEPYLHISKIIASDYPFTGSWTFEIAKINDTKTLVKLTEEGNVSKPFWRLIIKHIIGYETGAKQFLKELNNGFDKIKQIIEAEQIAESEKAAEEKEQTKESKTEKPTDDSHKKDNE